MLAGSVDYVLSPSSYVTRSFLTRGYRPEQILRNVYPVNLSVFKPASSPRPRERPLTIINTGSLSLRKGTPYLPEAFRLLQQKHPAARLLLTRSIREEARPILARRSADRMERSPLVQRILRDLAGYNLNAAVGFLGSLARFEEEESPA